MTMKIWTFGAIFWVAFFVAGCGGGDGNETNRTPDAKIYTLSYAAGAGGALKGESTQTVAHGSSGTAVTGVPDEGYSFVEWSDASTLNPRTDSNVTNDWDVTASFGLNSYPVTATSGTGGSIDPPNHPVKHGATATFLVTPNVGHSIRQVEGCDGSLTGNTYTTAPIVGMCTVIASFSLDEEAAVGPTAVGSCGSTPQDVPYSNTLTATDMDPTSYPTFTLHDGSLGPLITPKGGEVTITDTTTGDFVYTPGLARGLDTFQFKVVDTAGHTSTAIETVVVDQSVMPLGDSITSGYISKSENPPDSLRVGYREELQTMLKASGIAFDFVGTMEHGWDVPDFDFYHQGHGGWTAEEIAWGRVGFPEDGVRYWLDRNPADFILLHIGTNGLDPSNSTDVAAILDEIDLWKENTFTEAVQVIVGLIIDRDPNDYRVSMFNENVQTMVEERMAEGATMALVDHQNALIYPDDLADQLHPNQVGYKKMAAVWFETLAPMMDRCP